MALNLKHQTAAQFADRLKARFRTAERYEKAKIAAWMYDRVQAGDITVAQIKTAFDLDQAQWLVLRDRLLALKEHYDAIEAERAE